MADHLFDFNDHAVEPTNLFPLHQQHHAFFSTFPGNFTKLFRAPPATSATANQTKRKGADSASLSGKRRRKGRGDDGEAQDLIHVRARRGQATDSHSLAERARRGKINERLKLLQDIVPGCHKSMGMVVVLEETISYVQSLRNQIEFLSMQLAAARGSNDEFDLDSRCRSSNRKRSD